MNIVRRLTNFATQEMWRLPLDRQSAGKRFLLRYARIGFLVARDLWQGSVFVRSSVLTYQTILSLIPFFALLFVIAKMLGLQHNLLTGVIPTVNEYQQDILGKVVSYIQNTDIRALGWAGLVALLWMSITLLLEIENAFNEIWGIKQQRSFIKRIINTAVIIGICPVFILTATMFNAFLVGHVNNLFFFTGYFKFVSLVFQYLLVGLLFALVYKYVPNTGVDFWPALVAGTLVSVAWHVTQWIFIVFQVGVSRYNAIYGTFASLPLFLVWIYTSWLIVLVGCELCSAMQNVQRYGEERFTRNFGPRLVEEIGVAVYWVLVQGRQKFKEPRSAAYIGNMLGVPEHLVSSLLLRFCEAKLAEKSTGPADQKEYYAPATGYESVRPLDVARVLQNSGQERQSAPRPENIILNVVRQLYEKRERAVAASDFNRTFVELMDGNKEENGTSAE